MLRSTLLFLAALAAPLAASAHEHPHRLADVQVYDRSAQRYLPIHEHRGRHYIAGEPGHEYEIRVSSRRGERLLAVASVDGVNVLSGDTASAGQDGYVVPAYGELRIDGWRKSMDEVASFYFTALPDSYAARTGRPQDVGVIGVALFRERRQHWFSRRAEESMHDQAATGAGVGSVAGDAAAAPEVQPETQAQSRSAAPSAAPRLGTGHGQREWSGAEYTQFERASARPDEVLSLWYDSVPNLVRRGVLPARAWAQPGPQPFPADRFVPDP
jgi:hypothetical protein